MKNKKELYGLFNEKLATFFNIDNADFVDYWEERWNKIDISNLLLNRHIDLNEFNKPFMKYLKKNYRILEAGCGTGMYVKALHGLGYTIEGVDYALKTIQIIKKTCPELNVFYGDLCNLKEKEDGYYNAYISIGVVEHDINNPDGFLQEANRLLTTNGIMLISIPHLNSLRRKIKKNLQSVNQSKVPTNANFYQYYYAESEFKSILQRNGFSIIELYPYSVYTGMIKDISFFKTWRENNFFPYWKLGKVFKVVTRYLPKQIREKYCHMMMYICIKNAR